MQNRSSTWSLVLTFSDERAHRPGTGGDAAWTRAAALDTVAAITDAVEPSNVVVITDDDVVRSHAEEVGAQTLARGHDVNVAVTAAVAQWVSSHPQRSAVAVFGPLPYADADTITALLRACAATESALVAANDGGTIALSHHDPARLAPRFGGSSADRHRRTAVSVGSHLVERLGREPDPNREPAGARVTQLRTDAKMGR